MKPVPMQKTGIASATEMGLEWPVRLHDGAPLHPEAPTAAIVPPRSRHPEPVVDLAHELRTSLAILTLLSGNLDLLYERMDDARRRRMIRDIRKQMQRLNTLIMELLGLDKDSEAIPL